VTQADGRHDPIVVAVKDDGASFTIGIGNALAGPFEAVEKTNGSAPFRVVLSAKDFADPDLDETFKAAGVKREDVGTLTSYGIGIHGGWSLGVAIFRSPGGKVLGQAGWRMRLGGAVPCGDDAPYGVQLTRILGELDVACTKGEAEACDRLGAAYEAGDGEALPADPARGARYFQRGLAIHEVACDHADAEACSWVADAYDTGRRGATRDEARAFAMYDQGCQKLWKPDACFRIGEAYEQRTPTPEAYARAALLFDHACKRGDESSCEHLARLYAGGLGVGKDDARAVELRTQVCASGVADVCNVLGVQYDKGRGVTQDEVRAGALYKKACDAGEVAACVNLGELTADGRGVPRSLASAVALFKESCAKTSSGAAMFGCAGLGLTHEYGLGVPVSRPKAIELYRTGCKGGADWFCKRLTKLGARL
jgi:TPR repeat protein